MNEFLPKHDSEAEDQLFEQLLERYDEASALGLPVVLPEIDGLPPERHRELQALALRIDLVNQAARRQSLEPPKTDPSQADPFAGELIGRFRVLRELGRGGYGIVFLAFDSGIGRLVAVKLPRPEVLVTPELVARFLREAQAAGRIDHPHVLPVHEAAEDGGMCYLVTPYCRGLSLAEWMADRGPVPAHDVAQLGASLADALACAHEAGVLHRDIKPSNILLDLSATEVAADRELLKQRRLATFVPKLTDFGLAKLLQSSELETRTGTLVGTPTYMAPEQATGRYADVRTDVYSLGVVMYELLTSKLPADASSVAGLAVPGVQGRIVPPRKLRPSIPRDLEAVVLKCLEPAPVDRYPSAAALADDLNRFLQGKSTTARPAGLVRKSWKAVRRRPALSATLLLLLVAIGGLIGGNRWYAGRLDRTQASLLQREYASDLRQAAIARRQGSVDEARRLLARYEAGTAGANLRGFEWYWLRKSLDAAALTLDSKHGEAYAVALTDDGKSLYSGGKDGVIRVWNLADGGLSHELHGHDHGSGDSDCCVNQLAFSPDGATLASVSCDGTVRLWDVARRQQKRVLVSAGIPLMTLAYAHHHPWLAVDTHVGKVQVWDTDLGAMLAELGNHQENQHVDAIAFSPDDRVLAGTRGTAAAMLWETEHWSLLHQHDFFAISLAFVADGSQLVLGSRDWLADLVGWNVATGQRAMHVGKIPTNAQCLVGMRSDEVLFAGSANGVLKAFRLSNDIQHVLPTGPSRLQALILSRDDRLLAAAGYDGKIRVWDLERNRWPVVVESAEPVRAAVLSPDGRWLALNTTDCELFLWDCQLRRQVARADKYIVRGFSDSGRLLICNSAQGPTTALTVPDLSPLGYLSFPAPLQAVSVSADDKFIALSSIDGAVEVTDVRKQQVVLKLQTAPIEQAPTALALTSDGSQLVVIEKGELPQHAIDVASGKPAPITADRRWLARSMVLPHSNRVSPDGRWKLNIHDELGECSLEDTRTGVSHGHLSHRDFPSTTHAWSPDSTRLFISTRIGELLVIDTASGTQLCELDTPLGRLASPIVCSPDGERVMAFTTNETGSRGYVHVWQASRQ